MSGLDEQLQCAWRLDDRAEALRLAQPIYQTALERGDPRLQALALSCMAEHQALQCRFTDVQTNSARAAQLFQVLEMPEHGSRALEALSWASVASGHTETALEAALLGLELTKTAASDALMSSAWAQVGHAPSNGGDFDGADDAFRRAALAGDRPRPVGQRQPRRRRSRAGRRPGVAARAQRRGDVRRQGPHPALRLSRAWTTGREVRAGEVGLRRDQTEARESGRLRVPVPDRGSRIVRAGSGHAFQAELIEAARVASAFGHDDHVLSPHVHAQRQGAVADQAVAAIQPCARSAVAVRGIHVECAGADRRTGDVMQADAGARPGVATWARVMAAPAALGCHRAHRDRADECVRSCTCAAPGAACDPGRCEHWLGA